jgi:Set1/Ash2 histone methyltransferase complex subunit ASH2
MEVLQPLDDSEKCHVRVGWSTRQGELQAPVGFDQYSFCYRDLYGEMTKMNHNQVFIAFLGSRVHKSERYDDYGASFGPGDVIGCFISLDESGLQNKMIFFKNGVSQGEAYSGKDIPPAVYFPAVSLFNKVSHFVGYSFG